MKASLINNRYEVQASLGRGGMGEVLLVRDRERGNQAVALKTIEAATDDPRRVDHLRHEFSLLAHLSHPNLVEVYDFGFLDDGDVPFFTQEYVDGLDLLAAAGRLSADAMLDVVVQILRGLEYVHARGFLHRDIKPQNLMVRLADEGAEAKILDLSLAEAREAQDTDTVKGSLHYMAPEVLRGGAVDHRSDFYSLGLTLFHVLEGELPFKGPTTRVVFKGHLEKDVPPITRPGWAFLTPIVRKMTEKNPSRRHRTANEIIRALAKGTGRAFATQTRATRASYTRALSPIERNDALESLSGALLAPSRDRHGRAVYFVEGRAGTGKTRLLREFRHAVQMSNVRFVAGHPPRALDTPYWCFQGALEKIVMLVGPDSDLLDGFEASVVRLVPSLADARKVPERGGALDESQKLTFHAEVARFILAASAQVPMCLCFDDFERADEGSFDLVGALIRSLGEQGKAPAGDRRRPDRPPLSVVLAYDPDKLSPSRRQQMETSIDDPRAQLVPLNDLSPDGTGRLVVQALGHGDVPPGFTDRVYELTAGNPGLVVTTLESLMETGVIEDREGRWEVDPDKATTFPPPPDAASTVLARFDALSLDARVGLRVLSAASAALPGPLFSRVLERLGFDAFEAISPLVAGEFVARRFFGGETRYAIDDPAYAAAAQSLADGPDRAQLHRVIGEETEALHSRPSFEVVARLAQHFQQAGVLDKALDYTIRSARGFSQLGSFSTALDRYTDAIDLTDAMDGGRGGQAIELHFERAGVERVLGRYGDALEDLEHALQLAEESRSQSQVGHALSLLAELNLAWGKFFMTEVLGARAHALARETGDRDNLLRAEMTLGMLAFRRGEYALAEERLQKAEEISRHLGRAEKTAQILMECAGAQQKLGRLGPALENLRTALDIFKEEEHAQGIARCLASIGNTHFLLSEYDDALSHYRKSLRIHKESGDIAGTISVNYAIGNILFQIGLYPASRKYFEASLSLARTFHLPAQIALNTAGLGYLALVEGRLGTALDRFGSSLELYEALGARSGSHWAATGMGAVLLKLGRLREAREVLEDTAAAVEETGEIRVCSEVEMTLAHLELREGDLPAAAGRADRARDLARTGSLRDFEISHRLVLGEIALALGEAEEAYEAFTRAGNQARELSLTPELSEAHIGAARALLAFGRPGDALSSAQKGLESARRGQYNELVFRGSAAAGEAEVALGREDRAAFHVREAIERLQVTLADTEPAVHEAFLSDKQDVFERGRWLVRKIIPLKAPKPGKRGSSSEA